MYIIPNNFAYVGLAPIGSAAVKGYTHSNKRELERMLLAKVREAGYR